MRKYIIALIILGLIAGYFYISRQETLVVNEKGKITGLGNKLRALVQGNKFWDDQLRIVTSFYNKSIAPHPPSSADMRELYRKFRIAEDSLNAKMKNLYTPDEILAENYRIKADSILRAAKWKLGDEKAETVRIRESDGYKKIIAAIDRKLRK
jgi:hypothetical protein